MRYKKYILSFIYLFCISILVYLSVDLRADYKKMTGVCLIIAVMFTLVRLNFEKPVKKWYKERFDRNYKNNKITPFVKKKKEKEASSVE
jgi:hypothetical protein